MSGISKDREPGWVPARDLTCEIARSKETGRVLLRWNTAEIGKFETYIYSWNGGTL